ncbi:radical SAM protein [Bradyrhizobium arachidis]|uniref:radical SAM protein n=1 Tax=Bradyrhizobium arachidis TaxID=858423 RepID=UPI0021624CCD|nr:hypothetical protein [Bradyrhizobium arachidis]UVO30149.1 hypothetical protein KUF59_05115 [Bradyrhizobium arachidis]
MLQLERDPSKIEPDVLQYFLAKQSDFGCTNVLPAHLPTTSHTIDMARNAMTLDYAISKAYRIPFYESSIARFASDQSSSDRQCGSANLDLPGWFLTGSVYSSHLDAIRRASKAELLNRVRGALTDCIDSIHLFCPKQCNLTCSGCYASAVPIDKHPYTEEQITAYFDGVARIISQAQALGAKTIQTSGDGEVTVFPRFFDLLQLVASSGMQWLIFTAGLIFSSEDAAASHWRTYGHFSSHHIRERINRNIARFATAGVSKPTVRAFISQIEDYKDVLQIYHSVWSTSSLDNSSWRNPRTGNYDYREVNLGDHSLELPTSLLDLMAVFHGNHRSRFGVEFPVSDASVRDVPALAKFVAHEGLRSYFEPVIRTGRARRGRIGGQKSWSCENEAVASQNVAKLLARKECSFRFLHQPIAKFRTGDGFFASPGTGVDLEDLKSLGVLEKLSVRDNLFGAIHSPLIVNANYNYTSGCKCNHFSERLLFNRSSLAAEWQGLASLSAGEITTAGLIDRLGEANDVP